MEKKLKISKKVKYSLIAQGCSCGYSDITVCKDPLHYVCAYKSPVSLKSEGLYVKKHKD